MNNVQTTPSVVCTSCGLVNEYTTRKNGPHTEAICKGCDKHIKFLPSAIPALYVGKYKGKPISDIEDLNYLQWALQALKLSGHVRQAITDQVRKLQLTHR